MTPRFLLLSDVCEVLNISSAQAYALVRTGDLPAIRIGGRGQWRVEATELEAFIARKYAETRHYLGAESPAGDYPAGDSAADDAEPADPR